MCYETPLTPLCPSCGLKDGKSGVQGIKCKEAKEKGLGHGRCSQNPAVKTTSRQYYLNPSECFPCSWKRERDTELKQAEEEKAKELKQAEEEKAKELKQAEEERHAELRRRAGVETKSELAELKMEDERNKKVAREFMNHLFEEQRRIDTLLEKTSSGSNRGKKLE
ncbi:hypothetical protein CONLIGDRAFT_642684 [Coniochaeta ligniaria NRRL 30616]|uniref:Uncharacterized protein n=1 Tax=Coniochaeta ligniaria NRRL 30616 TaxID=1408157 RepID=A0A1J7ITG8_9PEZI|nr:hypothetical protein CONLIGDRAFT_642684 [Coniochaeta ligniaria NRRL 30616]